MKPTAIRQLRESLGMTQEDLARYLGLETKGAIAHLEAGRRLPTGPILRLLEILRDTGGKILHKTPN